MTIHHNFELVNSKGGGGVNKAPPKWYCGFCKVQNDGRDDACSACTCLRGTGSDGRQPRRPDMNYRGSPYDV